MTVIMRLSGPYNQILAVLHTPSSYVPFPPLSQWSRNNNQIGGAKVFNEQVSHNKT